jgi:histidinol-phosphatase (PHP family)
MEESCRQAVRLGLPAIAFTEHADHVPGAGVVDVEGYSESVDRCRYLFPDLQILSGVELGEPHRFPKETAALLRQYPFDLLLGSCHSIPVGEDLVFIGDKGTLLPDVAHESVRTFFAETLALIEQAPLFAVLTHVDLPKRYWPHDDVPFIESDVEEEYRSVLGAAAGAGMALEINTGGGDVSHGPCPGPIVVKWWCEAGGTAISFASDAHAARDICSAFDLATDIAESAGFRPASHGFGFWLR